MRKFLFLALLGALTLGAMSSCEKDGKTYYTVTFNSQGGSYVDKQKVEEGKHAIQPANPTRSGYDFVEWTLNGAGTEKWSFANDVVSRSVTLYAQWESTESVRVQLQTAVTMSAAYDGHQDEYTSDSWTQFQSALSSAKDALANSNATDSELQIALDNLIDAQDNLIDRASIKSTLDASINAAEALPSYGYTYDSYQALQQMLNEARTMSANDNATADQLQTALQNLNNAVNGLVKDNNPGDTGNGGNQQSGTDKGALNARIAYSEGLTQGDYTAASWSTFRSALANAEAVSGNSTASQAQIDSALSQLNGSIAGLEHVVISNPNADKSALQQSIFNAQQLNQSDYTPESWTNFSSALNAAVSVNDNPNATQSEIDNAYANLQNSTKALVKNTDSGLVRTLTDDLINAVAKLPNASQITPLNSLVLTPVAILADNIRDQLIPLLGDTSSVANQLTKLDDVLRALGLSNLI